MSMKYKGIKNTFYDKKKDLKLIFHGVKKLILIILQEQDQSEANNIVYHMTPVNNMMQSQQYHNTYNLLQVKTFLIEFIIKPEFSGGCLSTSSRTDSETLHKNSWAAKVKQFEVQISVWRKRSRSSTGSTFKSGEEDLPKDSDCWHQQESCCSCKLCYAWYRHS